MKQLWFFIIALFAQSILIAQIYNVPATTIGGADYKATTTSKCGKNSAVTNASTTKNVTSKYGAIETPGTFKNEVVLAAKPGPSATVNIALSAQQPDDLKCCQNNSGEGISEEEDLSFENVNDAKVQAAKNWFRNKKGLQ